MQQIAYNKILRKKMNRIGTVNLAKKKRRELTS